MLVTGMLARIFLGLLRAPTSSLESTLKVVVSPKPESPGELAKKNVSDAARPVLVSLPPTASLPLTMTSNQVRLMLLSGQINSKRSDPPAPTPGRSITVPPVRDGPAAQVVEVLLLPTRKMKSAGVSDPWKPARST